MKVFIIAAISADGFIARHASEIANWTSREDKKLFVELTKRAGVVVMGRTTFDTLGRALRDRRTIVYTRRKLAAEGVETTQLPPKSLIKKLEKENYKEVAICGGRDIYDQFLSSGVVDELYLTVEPVVFGEGVPLFKQPSNDKLSLKSIKKLNDNVICLQYEVIKQWQY